MTSKTTKARAVTTWTCDRCGVEESVEGEHDSDRTPDGWRRAFCTFLYDNPYDDEARERRHELCASCVQAYDAFMTQGGSK